MSQEEDKVDTSEGLKSNRAENLEASYDLSGDRHAATSFLLPNIKLPNFGVSRADIVDDGNNTTSRISTAHLHEKVNRRVSFAPDVTLHSFDSVPQQLSKAKEPRRKLSVNNERNQRSNDDPIVTSTQREENLANDESLDDLDDNTLQHLSNMTPVKTKHLKKLSHLRSNQSSEEENESMVLTQPISKVSNVDDSMDITQLFNKHSGSDKNVSVNGKQDIVEELEEETMEFTETKLPRLIPNDNINDTMELTNIQKPDSNKNDIYDETMEFTKINSRFDQMPSKSKKLNTKIDEEVTEGQSLEETEHLNRSDIPQLVKTQANDSIDYNNADLLQRVVPKIENIKSYEQSGKRRRLNNFVNSEAFEKASLIPTLSEKSPSKLLQQNNSSKSDLDLSVVEKLSPIKLHTSTNATWTEKLVSSEEHIDEKFKASNVEINNLQSNKSPNQTPSLRNFLEEIRFQVKTNTNAFDFESQSLNFQLTDSNKIKELKINQLYNIFFVDIPILDTNAFTCKELLNRISKAKQVFIDLEKHLPVLPDIVTQYYASPTEEKKLIRRQLGLIKHYSALEASKAWHGWRVQQLLNIETVLAENIALLNDELEKVNNSLRIAQNVKHKVENLRDALKREIKLLNEIPAFSKQRSLAITSKLEIERMKQDLLANNIKVGQLQNLKQKQKDLSDQINTDNDMILKLKKKIALLHFDTPKIHEFSDYELIRMNRKFTMIQQLFDITFLKIEGSVITLNLNLNYFPIINIDFSKSNSNQGIRNCLYFEKNCVDEVARYLFDNILTTVAKDEQIEMIPKLFIIFKKLKESQDILKQFHLLQLVYPSNIYSQTVNQKTPIMELIDYEMRSNCKITYAFSIDEFVSRSTTESGKLAISVRISGPQSQTKSDIQSKFLKKTSKLLPWLNEAKINMSIS